MIWEKIRDKIGQVVLYFISGCLVKPTQLDKRYNYLIITSDYMSDETMDSLHEALGNVIDGEITILSGTELNIIGLADEDQDK